MKHTRKIELTDWQLELVNQYPRELIKGLIESDGCRYVNKIKKGDKEYQYSEYSFCNVSADIRNIFIYACSLIDVPVKFRPRTCYIYKKEYVEKLDEFIGPKS